MHRKALIIANTDPLLTGVTHDITNIQSFLKSLSGGAWLDTEIQILNNASLLSLRLSLTLLSLSKPDYLMVFFTGHGGSIGRETLLTINNQKEKISQTELENITARQINIYDCCRSPIEIKKYIKEARMTAAFESSDNPNLTPTEVRSLYDHRVQRAIKQQAIFYSCKLGEVSHDEEYGALYLTNLLKEAANFSNGNRFKLALEAHLHASEMVKKNNSDAVENPQNPTYQIIKSAEPDDHLILGINPLRYSHLI